MNLKTRLRKLEGYRPATFRPCHMVMGRSDQECEAQRRGMIKAGQAVESDEFIFRVIVSPVPRHV
jgi:hypothetical protein